MASSNNFLTHDEIWDDSALVNAWDEALQEYKVSITPLLVVIRVTCFPNQESHLLMW